MALDIFNPYRFRDKLLCNRCQDMVEEMYSSN